jgi:hypothetical protein
MIYLAHGRVYQRTVVDTVMNVLGCIKCCKYFDYLRNCQLVKMCFATRNQLKRQPCQKELQGRRQDNIRW